MTQDIIRKMRLLGHSPSDIAPVVSMSRTGVQNRFLRCEFTPEEDAQIRRLSKEMTARKLSGISAPNMPKDVKLLKRQLVDLSQQLVMVRTPAVSDRLLSSEVGHLGELYVRYSLLRRGFRIFISDGVSVAMDVLVASPSGCIVVR